ncbi:MAG: hypothetical protein ACON4P_04515 [Candidatus Puniceispirillales bacterium]
MSCLEFLGRNARLVLPVGIVLAVFLPGDGGQLRVIVPFLIGLIYAVAFLQIDLKAMVTESFRPQQIAWSIAISLLILMAIPFLLMNFCLLIGIDPLYMPSVIWYAVAPPIASTAWMCGLLGLKMAVAMKIVVMTSLLSPFTGPVLASFFLGGAVPVSSLQMLFDLVMMIFGGILAAQVWKKVVGQDWIDRNATALSGLSVIAMLIFLVPVFNGVLGRFIATPEMALHLLAIAMGLNFSTQAAFMLLSRFSGNKDAADTNAVLAVVSGNRNVGLYYGALPPDPIFGLFTAMYQVPIYLTPLFIEALRRGR